MAGCVACMGKLHDAYDILARKPEGWMPVDGRKVILKCISRKWDVIM